MFVLTDRMNLVRHRPIQYHDNQAPQAVVANDVLLALDKSRRTETHQNLEFPQDICIRWQARHPPQKHYDVLLPLVNLNGNQYCTNGSNNVSYHVQADPFHLYPPQRLGCRVQRFLAGIYALAFLHAQEDY
jgi:hypothetical protein